MKVLQYALAMSALLVCASTASAQTEPRSTTSRPYEMETRPTNCAFHIATLDAAHDEADRDSPVIVIARLGDDEQRRDLNRRRLHNVRMYLTEFASLDPQTIITAEGERVRGYGRVELYVGGRLFYTLMIRPNAETILFALIFRDKLRVDGDLQGGRGDVASLGTPDRRSQTVVAR